MYITPEQLHSRIEGQSKLELKARKGVGKHKQLPHETKVLIGVLAETDSQDNVARAFSTSQANVSNISRGLTGGQVIDEDLKEDIDRIVKPMREQVSDKAINILMKSLGVVDSKVDKTKSAAEASVIAKNLAVVADKFSPRSDSPSGFSPKIQINIHGSKQKQESDFESIEVEPVVN